MGTCSKLTSKGQTDDPAGGPGVAESQAGRSSLRYIAQMAQVVSAAQESSSADLAGMFGTAAEWPGTTVEEMDEAMAEAICRSDERIRVNGRSQK